MTRRICEHCGESYTYAHTCPPPKLSPAAKLKLLVDLMRRDAQSAEKLRLVVGKLRDIQRATEGLAELLEEIET